MRGDALKLFEQPKLVDTCMVVGLSGWMDGGEVSTGTIAHLREAYDAQLLAEIEPDDFYIYNVPGPMEIAALFRPSVHIEEGLVVGYEEPSNKFYFHQEQNLILFEGKEPNLKWSEYADCIFTVADEFDVSLICFVGSVTAPVPHSRDPVFYSSVTSEELRTEVEGLGFSPTNYEGPSSYPTYLVRHAREHGIPMATLVAGIPPYIHGRNHKAIEITIRRLSELTRLNVDYAPLQSKTREYIEGIEKAVREKPDLESQIKKLEQAYDDQLDGDEQADLRTWFERQDMHLD